MIKKVLDLLIFTCLLIGVLMFSGCSSEEFKVGGNDGGGEKNYEASNLDFSTTQLVKLVLNYKVATGIVSTFDLYAENPLNSDGSLRDDLSPIGGGINVSGVSEITRVIPAYVEKLYLYSPNLFVPLLSYAEIKEGVASFSKVDTGVKGYDKKLMTRNSPDFEWKPVGKYLKNKSDFYAQSTSSAIKYDIINPDLVQEIPSEVFSLIGLTFPERVRADAKWYRDASIVLKDSAELFISLLHCGALNQNSFSYVVYEGPKELSELTEAEKMELEVINILQYADVHTNTIKPYTQGLTPGKYIQLLYKKGNEYVKKFPPGVKIGWILHCYAFDEANFSVKNTPRIFSCPEWNNPAESKLGENNRTIHFAVNDNSGKLFHCFGFEDSKMDDDDCNDLIFHIQANPVEAIDPPEVINPPDEGNEKSEKMDGVLAFEDKWPYEDDYDLNDVVVQYKSEITYVKKQENADATVKCVEDVFTFIHTGAAYNNAFSYKVNVDPAKVKKVTVDGKDYQPVGDRNGLIVDLCPNVREVITPWVYGTTPYSYTVKIEFVEGVLLHSDFTPNVAPYNPFIMPREAPKANTEIHLPMYPPTYRGDTSLFGTGNDCSDMQSVWYVSGTTSRYPFAIHLAGVSDEFVVPKEAKRIEISYPKYINWVESGFTQDKDWYLHYEK